MNGVSTIARQLENDQLVATGGDLTMSAHKTSDYIMTVPVVSLYHLTEKDIAHINYAMINEEFPRAAAYPQGLFVWMLKDDMEEGDPLLSAGFWKCFERHFKDTRAEDTVCIRFDEDGCELEGIPIRQ